MFVSTGLLALIAFLVIWLVLGHLFIAIIVGVVILALGGGVGYTRGPNW